MPLSPPITEDKLDVYITQLALCGKKRRSAELALLEPHSLWAYRKKNAELAEREAEALAFYREWISEEIEAEIYRRAIKGTKEPVFYEGTKCGHKRVYSDRLLVLLARRHIPEYREHITEDVNVKAGVLVVNTPLTVQDWEKVYGGNTNNSGTDGPAEDNQTLSATVGASPEQPSESGSPKPDPEGAVGDGGSGVR
jgi:hypothetical protein